jgi:hypothetical protein
MRKDLVAMKMEDKDFNAQLPSMNHSSCPSSGKRGNDKISHEVNQRHLEEVKMLTS